VPRRRRDLRDAAAHRAGADHGDRRVARQCGRRHRVRDQRRQRLTAGEPGRPLFEESGDAFAIVVAIAQIALRVALEIELLLERVPGGRVERALDCGKAPRRRLGETLCRSTIRTRWACRMYR